MLTHVNSRFSGARREVTGRMKQAPVPRRQGAKPAAATPRRGRKWDRIMTRLLIIGPPGSGKGTQAEQLARHFGIPAVSTGEIFRSNVSEETELGNQAASYLDGGDFVPDHLTNALVKDRLLDSDLQAGFLLDGYPRTAPQVVELDNMLASQGYALDAVIELSAPDELLEERMRRRAADQGRTDDTVEVFRRRLDLYHRETHEVVSVYAGRGILVSVNGSGDPGEITGLAIAAVEKFLGTPRRGS
ncbi:Adenylate kinase (EC 2.7.4.3) [Arthrobacter sp. DR-2P]|nr:Adenylate kinase (EC 2.7.4.3) [Arthrobacter sp. DR-2P]